MKILLAFLFCLLFCIGSFAQTEDAKPEPAEIAVEAIYLARDDGNGKAGEVVTAFSTADVPIHCIVELNSTTAAAVQMKLVAVKANGLKPGTNIITVNYKTNGRQNKVSFNASPENAWSPGTYRFDILINGRVSGSQSFEIRKNASQSEKENTLKAASKGKNGQAN